MSIQISALNDKNYNIYNNKNSNNNNSKTNVQSFKDILSSKSTGKDDFSKLDDEDKRLYADLKKSGVDLVHYTLDQQKHMIKTLGFPPLTAPSYVRKAWRETLGNMAPGQRETFQDNIMNLMCEMRSRLGVDVDGMEQIMNGPGFSYTNFCDDMFSTAGTLANSAGFDYAAVTSSLIDFKIRLGNSK